MKPIRRAGWALLTLAMLGAVSGAASASSDAGTGMKMNAGMHSRPDGRGPAGVQIRF